jgi:carbamoyl-phosphate synthase large subunit
MAIGRTFAEALGKAWRGIEKRSLDVGWGGGGPVDASLATPGETRLHAVADALSTGASIDEVAVASAIDPWFVDRIAAVVEGNEALRDRSLHTLGAAELLATSGSGSRTRGSAS